MENTLKAHLHTYTCKMVFNSVTYCINGYLLMFNWCNKKTHIKQYIPLISIAAQYICPQNIYICSSGLTVWSHQRIIIILVVSIPLINMSFQQCQYLRFSICTFIYVNDVGWILLPPLIIGGGETGTDLHQWCGVSIFLDEKTFSSSSF